MNEVQKYSKIKKIGQGVYGEIFAAYDRNRNLVALKEMENQQKNGISFTSLREIKILKEFQHQNIIALKDVYNQDNSIILVLEYCCCDLQNIIQDLDENDIKQILFQITQGLQVLHQLYVVHRDLTPANILINEQGIIKISDFGFAKQIGSPKRLLTKFVVTRYYRPPEIIYGSDCYGTKVDIWSLGCIFAEMILKKPLFQSENDFDHLSKIFYYCGTPTQENWPMHETLPNFIKYEEVQPTSFEVLGIQGDALDLLNQMLRLDPNQRISCQDILNHKYFENQQTQDFKFLQIVQNIQKSKDFK